MTEYLPLVDRQGKVIGKATREACHKNPSLLHPVVHLHILDSNGQLLLQKRSQAKDLFPGFWDTAVGGHVGYGESAETALARETKEELGIESPGAVFLYSYINAAQVETEYVYSYLLRALLVKDCLRQILLKSITNFVKRESSEQQKTGN